MFQSMRNEQNQLFYAMFGTDGAVARIVLCDDEMLPVMHSHIQFHM